MKNTTIEALSAKVLRFEILENLSVAIKIENNPYNLHHADVFAMAARKNNLKRSYLFVSKLLGKHIPVQPQIPFIASFLLAARLAAALGLEIDAKKVKKAAQALQAPACWDDIFNLPPYQGKILFIGFAETATALGQGVFSYFTGDVHFIHTTRENRLGKHDTIYFSEEHSHAPAQRLLIEDESLFRANDILVLIDDELSSGNTCLNIIRRIHEKYPVKRVFILTILEWLPPQAKEKYQEFCAEYNLEITVVSLLQGIFSYEGQRAALTEEPRPIASEVPAVKMIFAELGSSPTGRPLKNSGRLGLNPTDNLALQKAAARIGQSLRSLRQSGKTLCLGTGEFMYLPFLIAKNMGEGITVQSTTLSPVQPFDRQDYAVRHAIIFEDLLQTDRANFVYNIAPDSYEEVFIFWEQKADPQAVPSLVQALKGLGIKNIVFVNFE